jgi:two-component system nitrogen regulation response regulator NtrX
MHAVKAFLERAAAVRSGVLIRGEDGTGRRVLARAIHDAQSASTGPFVTVDCATDAGELELALFGVSGAPVKSSEQDPRGLERVGPHCLIREANGGTIYLQSVTEAPARVQWRLARILRDREALVGEAREAAPIDVRPMAGVEPGLEESLREGRVREDLFRRLSSLQIDLPPLRDRRDDIPALADHLLRETCSRVHAPAKILSPAAQTLLAALPWRGNATELGALIESLVLTLNGQKSIDIEDLLGQLRLDGGTVVTSGGGTLRQARARFEREYIAAVLEQHRGRISDAARTLGIQRTNLYRKMRSLQVGRIKNDTNSMGS